VIEHRQMSFGSLQTLMFMLAIDIDQKRRQGLKLSESRHRAVEENAIFPRPRHRSPDEKFVGRIESGLLEVSLQLRPVAQVEKNLHARLIRACPDQVGTGPPAKDQIDGIDNDRLVLPCFPGQDIETLMKGDVQLVDDSEVPDIEISQHVRYPMANLVSAKGMKCRRPA